MGNGTPGSAGQDVLAEQIKQLTQANHAVDEKLDDIDDKLLDPERGLFTKVKDVDVKTAENSEKLDEVKTDLDKLLEICQNHESRTTKIEGWMEDHEERDKELRDNVGALAKSVQPLGKDYDRRMGVKKWTDKILWAIIALLIAAVAADVNKLFDDDDRLDRIETMLKDGQSLHRHSDGSLHVHEDQDAGLAHEHEDE